MRFYRYYRLSTVLMDIKVSMFAYIYDMKVSMCAYIYIYIYIYKGKGKMIPLQARCGPEGG